MMIETPEGHNHNTEPDAKPAENRLPGEVKKPHRAKGLLAIGLFKLSKALFFFIVGVGALHLIHQNVGDLFLKIAMTLHFDPEGQFMGALQDKLDLVSGHQLRLLSLGTFGYATVSLVEGVGLMLQQTWAEYLTLTLTIGALPWEVFELFKHANGFRAGLLAINLAVLAYLLWFIRWHRRMMKKHDAEEVKA